MLDFDGDEPPSKLSATDIAKVNAIMKEYNRSNSSAIFVIKAGEGHNSRTTMANMTFDEKGRIAVGSKVPTKEDLYYNQSGVIGYLMYDIRVMLHREKITIREYNSGDYSDVLPTIVVKGNHYVVETKRESKCPPYISVYFDHVNDLRAFMKLCAGGMECDKWDIKLWPIQKIEATKVDPLVKKAIDGGFRYAGFEEVDVPLGVFKPVVTMPFEHIDALHDLLVDMHDRE